MNTNPPRRAERLMRWSLAPWERPAVLGDLNEEFVDLERRAGIGAARRWYWRQAILSTWPNLVRRATGDDARRAWVQWGLVCLALGLFNLGIDWTRGRHVSADVVLLFAGALLAAGAIVKKEFPPRRISKVRENVKRTGAFLVLFWAVVVAPDRAWAGLLLVGGSLAFGLLDLAWPLKAQPVREFLVSQKRNGTLDDKWLLPVTVPNEPLGISGLLLCRPSHGTKPGARGPQSIHLYDPTIERTFTASQSIRVCAIANIPQNLQNVDAVVEVVDTEPRVVRSVRVPVSVGQLGEVVRSWNDFAVNDPAEHFGQIDVDLPLEGLSAGEYRLRVSVKSGEMSSSREEAFSVVGLSLKS